jgi:maleate cis-trans isomerase
MAKAGYKIKVIDAIEQRKRDHIKELGIDRKDMVGLVIAGEVAILKGDTLLAVALAVEAAKQFQEAALNAVCVSKEMKEALGKGGSEKEIKKRYVDVIVAKAKK